MDLKNIAHVLVGPILATRVVAETLEKKVVELAYTENGGIQRSDC